MTVERRDMTDLSMYGDGQFDAVFCVFGVIGVVSDAHKKWMGDISRVVKPGGKFVMATWPDFTRSQYHSTMFGAVRAYLSQGMAAPLWAASGPPPAAPGAAATAPQKPLNFDNERDMHTLVAPHYSSVHIHTPTLQYGRAFHGGRDFWLSGKGAMPMFVPAPDPEVEKRVDEAAIAYLNAIIGKTSTAMLTTTSIITIATK